MLLFHEDERKYVDVAFGLDRIRALGMIIAWEGKVNPFGMVFGTT